ncbi:hydantoinase/oxoprolinase family protein [Corticibacterium sp. UT-5YL-CI-8]|nr:hydantoinase/oxoprolinase family protein [Tianweitania sp. UT-5YL-CI-8]
MSPPSETRTLSVAIDVGGTFTDVVLVDRTTGQSWKAKTPTTPPNFETGFITGINKALALAGRPPSDVAQVAHATTVATNAILEMRGAPAALLTTKGFRHVLEIGRHDIPRKANLYSWVKPKRPIPAHRIFEIDERLDVSGQVLRPVDEDVVRQAAKAIDAQGIVAVAVCFLHAFANASHEQRVRDILLEVNPAFMVSLSSEVLPVYREFERTMATILNAYVMPLVSSYVSKLGSELSSNGIDAPLLLMKSSGGVTGAASIRKAPIQTALSGPAAGIVGAVYEAGLAEFDNFITVDIGGTSADICLVQNGRPGVTTKSAVGEWPMTLPMVDIHTIGAGGGSIARLSEAGTLTVGPESAGALPGPVSYGRGGTEPTVTDAHLVLGHLPQRLLAGEMKIDVESARRAIEDKVARPLGMSVYEAATGILDVLNNNMLGAIRVVSVERGLDPRGFALLPFGGAGPLHGGDLARLIGSTTVIVPPSPGVLSAMGLTVSSLRNEFARTLLQDLNALDVSAVEGAFEEMQAQALSWLAEEQVPEGGQSIEWEAALRYRHQGFELSVPWGDQTVSDQSAGSLAERFHRLHEQLYSFAQEDTPIEMVTLRVTAIGKLAAPKRTRLAAGKRAAETIIGRQEMYVNGQIVSSPIYDRSQLAEGEVVEGPAILQQLDATTLLKPGERATVHPFGSLIVNIPNAAPELPNKQA